MSQEDKISCLVDLTQKVFLTVERELKAHRVLGKHSRPQQAQGGAAENTAGA